MVLDLRDMSFAGAALPEPFVKFELEDVLTKWKLLRRPSAAEARALDDAWEQYRRKLRNLGEAGGDVRVAHHVLDPLKTALGYATFTRDDDVRTREGDEDGGWIYRTADGAAVLRAWSVDLGVDVDAPSRRGRAYRFSPARIAERVLLAKGERVGVLTDGVELRVILCDPARTGSHLAVRLDKAGGWRGAKRVPDSYRLVQSLCAPAGVARVAELVDLARLSQTRVTKTLREQAQTAVLGFVQSLVDDPRNAAALAPLRGEPATLAATFWREALVVVYRLLFILRLESSADPARAFTFASTSLWRNTYSPHTALAPLVRMRIDRGVETGHMLGDGLRALFRLFEQGLTASELRVVPLGGMLFGEGTTPTLDALAWGEDAVAHLLDRLLWTPRSGKAERQRVHYGSLEVEDLGRVYEALLEKEPGLSTEPMCRLRRQKLEVVVPAAQGARYRTARPEGAAQADGDTDSEDETDGDEDDGAATKKATVAWVEEIPAGRFYLRTGLGRKATGSYYTPDAFVRFLVEKTLGPQVQARSPVNEPDPGAILTLKVLDPAMGSGHFLVGACRYLADKLYEACRLCDEKAAQHRANAENARDDEARRSHDDSAREYLARVEALPDPNDELLAYLPSRVRDGEGSALAQAKAQALCRRLVAVHCLYGVDKNPLAVELAKLALWLESYAEGLPLTFMDHRLVAGDSLTGPFLEHLATAPGRGEKLADDLYEKVAATLLQRRFVTALKEVAALEATVGKDVAEVVAKRDAKQRLDRALEPLRVLARVWTGGVMLGGEACDDAGYAQLVAVAAHEDADAIPAMETVLAGNERLQRMRDAGAEGVAYELVFPEVFWPKGYTGARQGFDAVLGNPPWDAVRRDDDGFFAEYAINVLDQKNAKAKRSAIDAALRNTATAESYDRYVAALEARDRINDRLFTVHQTRVAGELAGRGFYDDYMLFAEKSLLVLASSGRLGVVLPSGAHANEGATGLRRLLFEKCSTECCISFENRQKLFEIDSRFKFALLVVAREAKSKPILCGFYKHDPTTLFTPQMELLPFSIDFIQNSGGDYLSLLELRSLPALDVASRCYLNSRRLGIVRREQQITVGQEVNMTYEASRFTNTAEVLLSDDPRDPSVAMAMSERGYLPLHEGKTFHQYNDHWEDRPRYLIALAAIDDKPTWREAVRHYRLAFRDIARSTDERTGIFALLPPGVLLGNTAPCERDPAKRPHASALLFSAISNAYTFDWVLRVKNAAHVNLFILDGCPVPTAAFEAPRNRFLAHGALRLSCNHAGYAALWREQLGDVWREPGRARHDWPAVSGDDARWQVRAAIDAVVADAYGLTRAQYEHVLGGFSHKSYPAAPARCLAAYDALKAMGLAAFVQANDPYWDIPLVETLPKPVIELGGVTRAGAGAAEEKGTQTAFAGMDVGDAGVAKGKRGKKK